MNKKRVRQIPQTGCPRCGGAFKRKKRVIDSTTIQNRYICKDCGYERTGAMVEVR